MKPVSTLTEQLQQIYELLGPTPGPEGWFDMGNGTSIKTLFSNGYSVAVGRWHRADAVYPQHTHVGVETLVAIKGRFLIQIEGMEVYELVAPEVTQVPAGRAHTIIALCVPAEMVGICVPADNLYRQMADDAKACMTQLDPHHA